MSKKTISGALLAACLVIAACQLSGTNRVAAGFLGTRCLDQTGCCRRCPACDHVCKFDAEQVEEDIPCFDVESKVICIPRVVFPWQKSSCNSCEGCDGAGCSKCVHNGARTRKICVLKTDKYKCPRCKYTWSVEKLPCAGTPGGACDSGCAAPGCDGHSQGNETAIPYGDPHQNVLDNVHVEPPTGNLSAPK